MNSSVVRARPDESVLLVIDLQEKLLAVIHEAERVVEQSRRLIRAARLLQVPILATEQYPQGIGPTRPEVKDLLEQAPVLQKVCFSACGADTFWPHWEKWGRRTAVVCGVEAHVCVQQTVFDLRERGQAVLVAADAVSSRRPRDCEFALRRMERAGAVLTTVESLIFEWLGRAGTAEFKEALKLVK